MFRTLHRNIKIRLFVGFLFSIAQATTMPFMAIYFASTVGEAVAGLLLAIATMGSLLASFISGYYCDKIGRRPIMLFGEVVFLASYVLMAAANSPWWNSPWATFMAFLTSTICFGLYVPADDAMLLDVTDVADRPVVYGMFYWMYNLTLAIGSSVGAFLFEGHRMLLFTITGVAILITLFTTIFFIQETHPVTDAHSLAHPVHATSLFHVYRRVFNDRRFVLYLIGGLCAATLEAQLNNYIGIHLAKNMTTTTIATLHHISLRVDGLKMVGLLQTENTILVVLLATLAIRFVKRRDRRRTLFAGLALNAIGYVLMVVFTNPYILLGTMLVATIGEVINTPIRQAYLGELAPEEMRSSYAAMNGVSFTAARLVASLAVVLGAIVPHWTMVGITALFGFTGVMLLRIVANQLPRFQPRDPFTDNIPTTTSSQTSHA